MRRVGVYPPWIILYLSSVNVEKLINEKILIRTFLDLTWLSFLQVGFYNLESVILYKNTHVMQKHTLFLP